MDDWKQYQKSKVSDGRVYQFGEDLTGVSVSRGDNLDEGGMIFRDPQNHKDKWFVSRNFFNNNYTEV